MVTTAVHMSPASLALRETAEEEPDKVALEIDDRRVSYAELNAQADRLARRLVEQVDGASGERIALRANGTHELMAGFIAIQRAGLVSVPVDPTAPVDRLQTILADVEPSLLLSDVEGDQDIGLSVPVFEPLTFGADLEPVPIDRDRGELVSIVYTSGSTGTPKGIMLAREQMNALLRRLPEYQVPVGTRLGGLTAGTVSFIEQLVGGALCMRGTLVAYEIRRHFLAPLGPWLESSGIAAFATVPTVLRYLLPTLSPEQTFSSVQTVLLTGETGTWEDVKQLRRHLPSDAVIVNAFGLTETFGIARQIISSATPAGEGPLPAGTISEDMEVVIADPDGLPVAPGEPGEITIRSANVSLGYWRRPDLTRAAFRQLPDGRREVRTGDRGRLLSDGTLQHLGRLDHLVKISGNRVELGEVESELVRLEGVQAAAAAAYTDEMQSTRLAACLVPQAGRVLDPRVLRAALSRRLPGYMLPDRISIVDELPQLPGGKVDRVRISGMDPGSPPDESPDAAATELERSLAALWREILHVERVGRHDDFFQLGGDSMRAARLFVELDRRLGIDRPVAMLAEAPTIASLAAMLSAEDEAVWDALLAVQPEGTRPPLFVVHDGVGSLLYARGLVEPLGNDQPIYGLRCKALNGRPPEEASFEELAATYVRRIQAVYPHGPYLLYGVSLGGMIAFEIARQLLADGEDVPLVVLGDTPLPRVEAPLTSEQRRERRRAELARRSWGGQARYLLEAAKGHVEYRVRRLNAESRQAMRENRLREEALRRGEPVPVELRSGWVGYQYAALLPDWDPQPPFPERVLLLRVDDPRELPDRGWGALVGDALQIADVPGAHDDLAREASGAYVGPLLACALRNGAAADS